MYIPEELKVNKFADVRLPDNASYFSRFGQSFPGQQLYTGDESAPIEQNKVDDLDAYMRYASAMARESQNKSDE